MAQDRILTTHVGSLPRPQEVVDQLFAEDDGSLTDHATYARVMREAVATVVKRQVEAGVDVVSDVETSKISYATYIRHRLTGFKLGDMPRAVPSDLDDFPGNYSGSCCNSIDKAGYFMSCMSFRIYPS